MDLWLVLAFASVPAAANLLGGLLAEALPVSQRGLSLALHVAAGVVLAVVGLELMPQALRAEPVWVPLVAFVAGGAAFVLLDRVLGLVRERLGAGQAAERPLAVFAGVALDLFSDGVMIGTGAVIDPALGLLLAVGQAPADLPEGFAAVASLRAADVPRRQRLLLTVGCAVPVLLGAALGTLVLRDAPDLVTLSVLALTGGVLATLVVEEMVPEAHEGETSRLGAVSFAAGFALFAAVSSYLG